MKAGRAALHRSTGLCVWGGAHGVVAVQQTGTGDTEDGQEAATHDGEAAAVLREEEGEAPKSPGADLQQEAAARRAAQRLRAVARRRGGRRRAGGFLRGAFGGLGKLLSIGFAFQVLGAGLGALLAVVLPNALLGTQTWYRDSPWTRIAVRAAFAAIALPMLVGMLPAAMGGALLIGGFAAVGVSIIGTALNRPLAIGAGDTALSLQSFGFSGLGAYAPARNVLGPGSGFGAYAPTRQVLPFSGSPSGGGPRV